MDISGRIKSALQQKGITQREFASSLGISETVVSKWLNSKQNFTTNTIERIESVLGVKIFEVTHPEFQHTIFASYIPNKSSLNFSLLWEYDPEKFVLSENKSIVVSRVLERGNLNDYFAAFDICGGIDGFVNVVKSLDHIDKYSINFICTTLGINKSELKCCTRKRLNRRGWTLEGEIVEEVKMLSVPDIIAMKLVAISDSGDRMKDFVDISYLSTQYSLNDMLSFFEKKYPKSNKMSAAKGLVYFDDLNLKDTVNIIGKRFSWKVIEKRLLEMTHNADKIFDSFPE